MIEHHAETGSHDWKDARFGIPTAREIAASEVHAALAGLDAVLDEHGELGVGAHLKESWTRAIHALQSRIEQRLGIDP